MITSAPSTSSNPSIQSCIWDIFIIVPNFYEFQNCIFSNVHGTKIRKSACRNQSYTKLESYSWSSILLSTAINTQTFKNYMQEVIQIEGSWVKMLICVSSDQINWQTILVESAQMILIKNREYQKSHSSWMDDGLGLGHPMTITHHWSLWSSDKNRYNKWCLNKYFYSIIIKQTINIQTLLTLFGNVVSHNISKFNNVNSDMLKHADNIFKQHYWLFVLPTWWCWQHHMWKWHGIPT